jgi:enoyl-CoA hydratase
MTSSPATPQPSLPGSPVSIQQTEGVHTIALDDGKANALSPTNQAAINAALDEAEAAGVAVVLAGRTGLLSGGFDLKVLQAGGVDAVNMLRGGFQLSHRLLSFPRPVVIACTGHAVAMGCFLLLSCDTSVAAAGAFRIVANEVAIGMTMPNPALALLRNRLTPAAYQRAAILAQPFSPEAALTAGFVDRVVEPDEVISTAQATAAALASGLNTEAHLATKLRTRQTLLNDLLEGIETDFPLRNK